MALYAGSRQRAGSDTWVIDRNRSHTPSMPEQCLALCSDSEDDVRNSPEFAQPSPTPKSENHERQSPVGGLVASRLRGVRTWYPA